MRNNSNILTYLVILFLILPVIIMQPQLSGGPYEIVPTRNLFLVTDFPSDIRGEDEIGDIVPLSSEATESSPQPMTISAPLPAAFIMPKEKLALQPDSVSDKPMGKGWAQVNLYSSVESPTEMIEDRQRYMASGLFNVHVYHNFAG